MTHFNYNGKLFPENEPVIGPQNRGLRYGDGLFETIKFLAGKPLLFHEHYERLISSMKLLQFIIPPVWSAEKMEKEITALAEKNGLQKARIRMNIFRGNGGLYDPENHQPNYIIEASPLPLVAFNENGLQLCIYRDAVKSADGFSHIKSNNALPYILGAFFAKENKCNDAVVLNQYGRVCEATIANLFIIKNGLIKTPAISEGCIAGIMRSQLLVILKKEGYQIIEESISTEEMTDADEVFLSNSIQPVRWVKEIAGRIFSNERTAEIFQLLQNKYSGIIY